MSEKSDSSNLNLCKRPICVKLDECQIFGFQIVTEKDKRIRTGKAKKAMLNQAMFAWSFRLYISRSERNQRALIDHIE